MGIGKFFNSLFGKAKETAEHAKEKLNEAASEAKEAIEKAGDAATKKIEEMGLSEKAADLMEDAKEK